MRFAGELENMDENDPRAMAAAVRRMTEIAGEPVTPAMEEMIRRLEAGEDPEQVEEDLGDALEEEMGDDGGGGFGGARTDPRRRHLPDVKPRPPAAGLRPAPRVLG